jgi:Ca2+/Na+ antiporter
MHHIFNQINKHPQNYVVGVILLFSISFLLIYYRFEPHIQRQVVYLASALYLGWSLWHHYRRGDITVSIMMEYLLLALFALIVVSATL